MRPGRSFAARERAETDDSSSGSAGHQSNRAEWATRAERAKRAEWAGLKFFGGSCLARILCAVVRRARNFGAPSSGALVVIGRDDHELSGHRLSDQGYSRAARKETE